MDAAHVLQRPWLLLIVVTAIFSMKELGTTASQDE